jgi:RNA polymerase sigma-70 factor (ECF subfamily)
MTRPIATRPIADRNTDAERSPDWAELVTAARQGDDDAFGQICDHMMQYLLLTADGLGNGVTAKFGASDIVQQALIEARGDIANFQGSSEGELRAWLVRLVRHNMIDTVRRFSQTQMRDASREQPTTTDEIADEYGGSHKTASSIVRQRETDDELLRALAQLPVRRRRVIELRHWQGLSFPEIGRELDITDAAARKLAARALDELRRKLAADHARRPTQPR